MLLKVELKGKIILRSYEYYLFLLLFIFFCYILKDFIFFILKYNFYWILMNIIGFVWCIYLKLKFDLFIYLFYI